MVPCLANWPGFYGDIRHEGFDTNAGYRTVKIFQNPGKSRAS